MPAVFDTVDLFVPDVQLATEAAYIRLPPAARERCRAAGLPLRDGVHAASHALLNVLPLHIMCSPNEVGTGAWQGGGGVRGRGRGHVGVRVRGWGAGEGARGVGAV